MPVQKIGVARGAYASIIVLSLMYTMNYLDRSIINVLGQAIKEDLKLSDTQLGILGGLAFSILYGLASVPIARLAERRSRTKILIAALSAWSFFTMACGFAGGFWSLFLARVGVGVGEAGFLAPAQSMLADLFPPHRRVRALSILMAGAPLGILIGAACGGLLTTHFNWRVAFLVVGAPGIFLALVAMLVLKEPPRGGGETADTSDAPPLLAVLKALARPSFILMLVAGTLVNFSYMGFLQFAHPLFVRHYAMDYGQAAIIYGVVSGASALAGLTLGGIFLPGLAERDRRFYGWFPALAIGLSAPAMIYGLMQSDWRVGAPFLLVGALLISLYYAPTFAVLHGVVGPRMRASAVALTHLVFTFLGAATGPMAVGYLSDRFTGRTVESAGITADCASTTSLSEATAAACHQAASAGLQHALIVPLTVNLLAALLYLLAARTVRRDMVFG